MKKRNIALITVSVLALATVPAAADPVTIGTAIAAWVGASGTVGAAVSAVAAFAVAAVEGTALPVLAPPLCWSGNDSN